MVLLMFAYRTHERLSANTRISFDPTLAGKQLGYEASTTIDGMRASSGQRIPIGWHTLTITHPKTKSFSTNLFVWYGEHELGQISLERATGTLAISAMAAVGRLTVSGPEFSIILTNSFGFTSSVPADLYFVQAASKYWGRKEELTVSADATAATSIAPRLGAIKMTTSQDEVIYALRDLNRELVEGGGAPTILSGLPEGDYLLDVRRKGDKQEFRVTLKAGVTNEAKVEFVYGAATISSDPPGATVIHQGAAMGVTPTTLNELKPGDFEFTLQREDHELAAGWIAVVAGQTNSVHKDLISRRYVDAMQRAKLLYSERDYQAAAEVARDALKYKAGDEPATKLEREATELAQLSQREQAKRQNDQRASNLRQQRLSALQAAFHKWWQPLPNATNYSDNVLVSTNSAKSVATAINNALCSENPKFEVINIDWPDASTFVSVLIQREADGMRICVIAGSEVQNNETHIHFKVVEFQSALEVKVREGSLSVTVPEDDHIHLSITEFNAKMDRLKARLNVGRIVASHIRLAAGVPLLVK